MGVKGKYFMIVSKSTGLALDVKAAEISPGTSVVMWKKHGNDNQLWYADPLTGSLRSKASKLCLDINGSNRLVVNAEKSGDANQRWHYNKHRHTIDNGENAKRVLDVVSASTEEGAEVCAWDHHGQDNQQWKIEATAPRYFFIKSAMNGKVLDIEGGSRSPGAKVIMYGQKSASEADNQLWFEDRFGNVRSKLDPHLVLDASGDSLRTAEFEKGDKKKFWCVHGEKLVDINHHNQVLDIKACNKDDCAEVCSWEYHGGDNQRWHFEHV